MREINECTFEPQLSRYNPALSYQRNKPRNFEKSIGRIRYAWNQKQLKKQKLESISRGENYEYLKSLPENAPFCYQNYRIKSKKPFLYLDINVGNGKKGKLALHVTDDPFEKARSFSMAFQLNEEMENGLVALIQNYIDQYKSEVSE